MLEFSGINDSRRRDDQNDKPNMMSFDEQEQHDFYASGQVKKNKHNSVLNASSKDLNAEEMMLQTDYQPLDESYHSTKAYNEEIAKLFAEQSEQYTGLGEYGHTPPWGHDSWEATMIREMSKKYRVPESSLSLSDIEEEGNEYMTQEEMRGYNHQIENAMQERLAQELGEIPYESLEEMMDYSISETKISGEGQYGWDSKSSQKGARGKRKSKNTKKKSQYRTYTGGRNSPGYSNEQTQAQEELHNQLLQKEELYNFEPDNQENPYDYELNYSEEYIQEYVDGNIKADRKIEQGEAQEHIQWYVDMRDNNTISPELKAFMDHYDVDPRWFEGWLTEQGFTSEEQYQDRYENVYLVERLQEYNDEDASIIPGRYKKDAQHPGKKVKISAAGQYGVNGEEKVRENKEKNAKAKNSKRKGQYRPYRAA